MSHKMNLENSPHLIIPNPAILDMTYGQGPADLSNFLLEGQEAPAKRLLEKPPQFWLDLIKDIFSTKRYNTLRSNYTTSCLESDHFLIHADKLAQRKSTQLDCRTFDDK